MADEFTAKFKVDISDLKKNLTEANASIKKANATFKAETAGMDKWTKDADGLSAKLQQLDKVLDAQKKILSAYKEELQRNKDAYEQNGKRADELRAKLQELADKGVDKSSDEYQKYRKELTEAEKEQAKNAKAVEDLELKVLDQTAAVKDTEKQMRHYGETLEDLGKDEKKAADNAEDLGDATKDSAEAAKKSKSGFEAMEVALGGLIEKGIEKAIGALKDLAKGIYDAWQQFDEGADNITKLTGATGEAAKELQQAYSNVAKTIVGDFSDIGNAIGEVNTRFGATGKELEELTTQFLQFAEINGTDVIGAIDGAQAAMAAWGISTEQTVEYLDMITKAGQDTGTSIDSINGALLSNATAFQEMGLGIEDAAFMLANFEKNGVDSAAAMTGLKKALQNAVKEGKPLGEAFAEIEGSIKGAKDQTEAMRIASELFGNKAGPALAAAIRDGRLSFEEMGATMEDFQGTVAQTYEATLDGPDKIQLALQNLRVQVAELFGEFLDEHGPELEAMIETFVTKVLPGLMKVLELVFGAIDKDIKAVEGWGLIFQKTGEVIKTVAEAIKKWVTDAVNKIGEVLAALPAKISGIISQIKSFFSTLWENLKRGAQEAWNGVTQAFANVGSFFSGLWEKIRTTFSGLGTKIGDAIGGAVKSAINGVIRQIENVINRAIGIINGAIGLINKLPGVSVSRVSTVSLPRLAEGGILKKGQVGLLEGSGDEAVVPLHNNKKWIKAVAADMTKEIQGGTSIINNASRTSSNVSYTQIINAPKAPSRIELYRQTRNLLAYTKGGVA